VITAEGDALDLGFLKPRGYAQCSEDDHP
jgi:hypothetical protein